MDEFYLNNSTRRPTVSDAVQMGKKLIGLVGQNGTAMLHAVTFVKIENGEYVFKNSYGDNQNIINQDPLRQPFIKIPVNQPAWSQPRNGL